MEIICEGDQSTIAKQKQDNFDILEQTRSNKAKFRMNLKNDLFNISKIKANKEEQEEQKQED